MIKLILKTQNSQKTICRGEKKNAGDIIIPDFKIYYSPGAWYWQKDGNRPIG